MNRNYEESLDSIETWMPPEDYVFSASEKRMLRPVAETFAMMDGNAFFDYSKDMPDHYEQYLPEAYALVSMNGGYDGVLAGASFVKAVKAEQSVKWFAGEIWNDFLYHGAYAGLIVIVLIFASKFFGVF